jgi:hypothetical protein
MEKESGGTSGHQAIVMDPMGKNAHAGSGKWAPLIVVAIAAIIIAVIVNMATVRDVHSDSRCSLVVSQSILENRTITLDRYKNFVALQHSCVREYNGHYYDYFPLGTAVLSLPAVMFSRSMGMDMKNDFDNERLQIWMVTFIVPGIFVIIFYMGRLYVSAWTALAISLVSVAGSSLISSLGTALWSQCMGTLLILLALVVIVRHDVGIKKANPYLLGLLLMLSFLTRPTASIFIFMVFAYFFLKDRKVLIPTVLLSLALLMGFVAFSYSQYSQILPSYYLGRLNSNTPFFTALYGLLLSPARGLFIFSPFLLVVTGLGVYFGRSQRKNALLVLLLGEVHVRRR